MQDRFDIQQPRSSAAYARFANPLAVGDVMITVTPLTATISAAITNSLGILWFFSIFIITICIRSLISSHNTHLQLVESCYDMESICMSN